MTRPLPVRYSRRAAAQIEDQARWWAENRPAAPGAVVRDIGRAVALITEHPAIGELATNTKLRNVRRVLLPAIYCYLYYRCGPEGVLVLGCKANSREREPRR